MTDADLLENYIQTQDRVALGELVARYINLVYSAALRQVRDSHLAEDVTQAVFLILTTQAERIRNKASLASWLYSTTRYAANNAIKMEARRRQREKFAAIPDEFIPDERLWDELSPLLDAAIARLSEDERIPLLEHYFLNRPLKQIASRMEISEDAVQKRVQRAVEKLRNDFAEDNVSLTPAALFTALSAQASANAPSHLLKSIPALIVTHTMPSNVTDLADATTSSLTRSMFLSPIPIAIGMVLIIGALAVILPNATRNNYDGTTSIHKPPAGPTTAQAAHVRRGPSEVWLEGVERERYGNSVIGAITTTIRATGEDLRYEHAMGLSGAAFRLQIRVPDWCAAPAFSIDRVPDLMHALGRTFTQLTVVESSPTSQAQRRATIVQSIDSGRPVLFLYNEAGLILGYQIKGNRFFYRPYDSNSERTLLIDWDWAAAATISDPPANPLPRRDAIIRSLNLAIELAHLPRTNAPVADQYHYNGLEAWQLWADQLLEDKRFDEHDKKKYEEMMIGNAWTLAVLIDARTQAARYLQSVQGDFSKDAVEHLNKAAENYQKVAQTLEPARALAPYPWTLPYVKWTPDLRRQQSDLMISALSYEKQALAEIAEALTLP